MKYILIFNLFIMTFFFSKNIIFLPPVTAQVTYENEFKLTREDIRLIQHYFSIYDYKNNFSKLPKNISSKELKNYFAILKNQKDKKWIAAYLFLLSIVPDLFEEDIGC